MIDVIKKYISLLSVKYWLFVVALAFFRTVSLYFYDGQGGIKCTRVLILLADFLVSVIVFAIFIILLRVGITKFTHKLFDDEVTINKWLAYGVLFFGWLPNLIVKYPGAMCWDSYRMLHYYFREGVLDAHHSELYSLIIGKSVQFFEQIGHINLALLTIVIGQYLLSVFVFGYSIQLFGRMKIRKWVIGLVIAFYLLCPYIVGYLGVVIKDVPYSVLIFLITILLIEFSLEPYEFCRSGVRLFLLFFSILFSCLLRKNGIYVIGLSSLFFIPAIIKSKGSKQFLIPFLTIVVSCLSVFVVKYFIGCRYEVRPGSIAEALSVPFQQTARYVKYHEKDVTDEERVAIDDVLIYKTLADRYKPGVSDSVKDEYLKDDTKLPAYFKVWFKQFFRHPFCYIAATWDQNLYLFIPSVEFNNISLYLDYDVVVYECGKICRMSYGGCKSYEHIFDKPFIFEKFTSWAIEIYKQLHRPIPLGIMSNISVNTYILLFLFYSMFMEKKTWQYVFPIILLSVLCVIIGPVIHGQPRYMFPVIYSMPSLIVYTLVSFKKEPTEDCQDNMIDEG